MEEKNIEKKEEVKDEVQEIKRPWQGTFYSILTGIVGFFVVLYMLNFILSDEFIIALKDNAFGVTLQIVIVFVLMPYFIIGFYRGWKWAVTGAVAFYGFSVFIDVGNNLMGKSNAVEVLSGLFALYLAVECLRHPFYNQKKVEQKS